MNQKQKWMLAAGLCALSAAVWTPQLLARSGAAAVPSAALDPNQPAFPGAGDGAAVGVDAPPPGATQQTSDESDAATTNVATGADATSDAAAVADSPRTRIPTAAWSELAAAESRGSLDRLSDFEQLLTRLRNFGVARPRPALDPLLANVARARSSTWTVASTDEAANTASSGSGTRIEMPGSAPPIAAASTHGAAMSALDPLRAFVHGARLSACLVGPAGSSAILNGRVVRVGDVLEAGISVDAIAPQSVVLRWNGARESLALTRTNARATNSTSSAANSTASSTTLANGATSNERASATSREVELGAQVAPLPAGASAPSTSTAAPDTTNDKAGSR